MYVTLTTCVQKLYFISTGFESVIQKQGTESKYVYMRKSS